MSCSAFRKSGKACTCSSFVKREKDGKCTCKHTRAEHAAIPDATAHAVRPSVLNILKMFEDGGSSATPRVSSSSGPQSQTAAARAETNAGFRPKKDNGGSSKVKPKGSASKEVATLRTSKVGAVQLITCGITDEGELAETKAPSKSAVEKHHRYGLIVRANADGSTLEFRLDWSHRNIDHWLRELFPKAFQWLDRYGELGPGEFHWQLVGKEYRTLFLLERPNLTGGELFELRGPSSRSYREWELRVATRRAIPEEIYSDWDNAMSKPLPAVEDSIEDDSDAQEDSKSTAASPSMSSIKLRRSRRGTGKAPHVNVSEDSDDDQSLVDKGKAPLFLEDSDIEEIDHLSDTEDLPSMASILSGGDAARAGPSRLKRTFSSVDFRDNKRPKAASVSSLALEPLSPAASDDDNVSISMPGPRSPSPNIPAPNPTPASPEYVAPKRVFADVPKVAFNPWWRD